VHKRTSYIVFTSSDTQRQWQQHNGNDNIICWRQAPHAQVHELHFALCVVIQQQQHTTMLAISHHAQAHELFILATMAKNVDNKALMRKRTMHELSAQAHNLSISHLAQAHKLLISHLVQVHKLLITAATTCQ
jgi:hypothetical protein